MMIDDSARREVRFYIDAGCDDHDALVIQLYCL